MILMPLCVIGTGLLAEENVGTINVKELGARGDNVTDDTKAIQAAFEAQEKYPYKEVVFPAGSYRIRDAITMYAPNVRGEGPVSIYQETPGKDIFFVKFAWRGSVTNLSFFGGARQLNLRNIRVDQGLLFVERCSFNNSSDFAIYMEPRSEPMHFVIRGCHFNNCEQVLHTVCDWTTLSDCWITTARMKNKAAIEARGAKLLCENIVGVPIVAGPDDRWIDNYGNLTCRNFRFGGEGGGFTAVWNFARAAVMLDDCYIGGQGSGRKCAVYCEEIPNILTIRNCSLTVPAVEISPKINLKEYFKHVPAGVLEYDVAFNSGEFNDDPQTLALLEAAKNRDTSPAPLAAQLDLETTKTMLAKIAAKVEALKSEQASPAESNGHRQKTDPKDYVEVDTHNAVWDVEDFMDMTTVKNSEYIAMAQAGDDIVFMRRAPNGPSGAWPHVLVRDVEVDLDKTPFISWKQKDPGPDPLPEGFPMRDEAKRLDPGIAMPMGFGLRITDDETQRTVLLFEIHTPPWFDYGVKDLRKLFGVSGGKRTFTLKYYPLGVYITGLPGGGSAQPGEYQVLDFLRFEAE